MAKKGKIKKSKGKSKGNNNMFFIPKRGGKGYLPNLKLGMWKKGQSGNPEGRKKGQRDYATIYRAALENMAKANDMTSEQLEEYMEQVGMHYGFAGDYRFFQDFRDRIHSKPTQKTEITGKDGKDLIPDNDSKAVSDALIAALINDKNTRDPK